QLIGTRFPRLIVLPRERHHEWTDISHDSQFTLPPELLKLRQVGMEAKRAAAATRWIGRKRQKAVLRDRQSRPFAGALVCGIASCRVRRPAERHDGIVAIVAA